MSSGPDSPELNDYLNNLAEADRYVSPAQHPATLQQDLADSRAKLVKKWASDPLVRNLPTARLHGNIVGGKILKGMIERRCDPQIFIQTEWNLLKEEFDARLSLALAERGETLAFSLRLAGVPLFYYIQDAVQQQTSEADGEGVGMPDRGRESNVLSVAGIPNAARELVAFVKSLAQTKSIHPDECTSEFKKASSALTEQWLSFCSPDNVTPLEIENHAASVCNALHLCSIEDVSPDKLFRSIVAMHRAAERRSVDTLCRIIEEGIAGAIEKQKIGWRRGPIIHRPTHKLLFFLTLEDRLNEILGRRMWLS